MAEHICLWCHKPFRFARSLKLYCSLICKHRFHWHKRKVIEAMKQGNTVDPITPTRLPIPLTSDHDTAIAGHSTGDPHSPTRKTLPYLSPPQPMEVKNKSPTSAKAL